MATQVRHGPSPTFTVKTSGRFSVTVVGHYTDRGVVIDRRETRRSVLARLSHWFGDFFDSGEPEPETEGLGAGGVTDVVWQSNRPEKRVAELLILRTCFRDWYERTMRDFGKQPNGAYRL